MPAVSALPPIILGLAKTARTIAGAASPWHLTPRLPKARARILTALRSATNAAE